MKTDQNNVSHKKQQPYIQAILSYTVCFFKHYFITIRMMLDCGIRRSAFRPFNIYFL